MSNTTKLTLGQAAKEAGISKPSLSAAIKKGRISAHKNESGVYEIDPSELFRVYPRKGKDNEKANSEVLSPSNHSKRGLEGGLGSDKEKLLGLLLAEKESSIKRLERDVEVLHQALEKQTELAKSVTRLLESKESVSQQGKSIEILEQQIANQKKEAQLEINKMKEEAKKKEAQIQKLLEAEEKRQKRIEERRKEKEQEEAERQKSFLKKLFG